MNNTIWQIVAVIVGLVSVAFALSYVSNTLFSSESQCEHACSFNGYRCKGDISETCLDNDFDMCREYSAQQCGALGCDPDSGLCLTSCVSTCVHPSSGCFVDGDPWKCELVGECYEKIRQASCGVDEECVGGTCE